MRSLDLPLGSIVMVRDRIPDGIYSLKKGLMGVFDKMNRLMMVIYKDEYFGIEALYGEKSQFEMRSMSNVDIEIYDLDEFRKMLNLELKGNLVSQLAKRLFLLERRYNLTADVRMRDIIRELLDKGVPGEIIRSLPLSLGANDSLAFERVIVEFNV